MRKEIILCDCCNVQFYPSRGHLTIEKSSGSAIKLIKYNEVCQECANKIAEFLESLTRQTKGGSNG
jgi:hypothetical protein